jgi:hypothetical protein
MMLQTIETVYIVTIATGAPKKLLLPFLQKNINNI